METIQESSRRNKFYEDGWHSTDFDFLEDFQTSLNLPEMCGVFPLTLTKEGLIPSRIGLLCSFLMILVISMNIVIQGLNPDNFGENSADITLNLLQWCLMVGTILYDLYVVLRYRGLLQSVLADVLVVKKALRESGVVWKPHSPVIVTNLTVCLFIFFSIYDMSHFISSFSEFSYVLSYYYCSSLQFLLLSVFMWFLYTLEHCFAGLHPHCLAGLTLQKVPQLILLHAGLVRSCTRLDAAFSTSIGYHFATAFIISLTDAYQTTKYIIKGTDIPGLIVYAVWTVVFLVYCFRVILASVTVKNQAENFNDSLYQVIIENYLKDELIPDFKLKVFYHFTGKLNVDFTMFGVFQLQWSVLYTMIAGGTTYLIFIVQFLNML